MICSGCGRTLTKEEIHYYGQTCDDCEREWSERMTKWRLGGEDQELDLLYSGGPTVAVH